MPATRPGRPAPTIGPGTGFGGSGCAMMAPATSPSRPVPPLETTVKTKSKLNVGAGTVASKLVNSVPTLVHVVNDFWDGFPLNPYLWGGCVPPGRPSHSCGLLFQQPKLIDKIAPHLQRPFIRRQGGAASK